MGTRSEGVFGLAISAHPLEAALIWREPCPRGLSFLAITSAREGASSGAWSCWEQQNHRVVLRHWQIFVENSRLSSQTPDFRKTRWSTEGKQRPPTVPSPHPRASCRPNVFRTVVRILPIISRCDHYVNLRVISFFQHIPRLLSFVTFSSVPVFSQRRILSYQHVVDLAR